MTRVRPAWLALREPADATARSVDLVEMVRPHLAAKPRTVIHDLGCGTGSMGRWLAPQLAGRQQWVMHDQDADLLKLATSSMVDTAADGAAVTAEGRERDVTRLVADDLADVSLVTASALLDMLTAPEVARIAEACAGAGCPTLLTISVLGQVELNPSDPLDVEMREAFNGHQRRTAADRKLLGPDAVDATVEAFSRRGATVTVRPSPWRLGAAQCDLMSVWFTEWVAAACEQRPELTGPAEAYTRRRLADASAGRLEVVVHHSDLLAIRE